jgi:trans-aconitate methyltransferase
VSDPHDYAARIAEEAGQFDAMLDVHDLPATHHLWNEHYLLPKLEATGLHPLWDRMADLVVATREELGQPLEVVSLGAGNCDLEVQLAQLVLARGCHDVRFTCIELSQVMLDRGHEKATSAGVADRFSFEAGDLNAWQPEREVGVFLANHSLHHVVELERLFDAVARR